MSPNSGESPHTLYEELLSRAEMKNTDGTNMGRPVYTYLGSGSDFTYFRGRAGVPVMNIYYVHDEYHRAIGQLWLALTTDLTEAAILPFNLPDYAWTLNRLKDELFRDEGANLDRNLPGYRETLTQVIDEFTDAAKHFMSGVWADNIDPLAARQINDQMIQLERTFLDPNGIPERTHYKHLIFAPSKHNSYAGASFPDHVDLLFEIKDTDHSQWERVKQHFSVILFTIQSATSTLRDVDKFV